MNNQIRFSNQMLQSFGNLLLRQQDQAIQPTKHVNPTAQQVIDVSTSELQIAYMNIDQNVLLVVLRGQLDGSTYETLIHLGEPLVSLKAKYLIVDMSEVSTLSNSGVIALNNLIRLMNGKSAIDIDQGWNALHTMEVDFREVVQSHVKILCPQNKIFDLLTKCGITQICQVFSNLDAALKPMGWMAKD